MLDRINPREVTSFALSPVVEPFDNVSVGNARTEFARLFGAITFAMNNGQKIEAIKLYRSATGSGLKESKDAVEALFRAVPTVQSLPPTPPQAAPMASYAIVVHDTDDTFSRPDYFGIGRLSREEALTIAKDRQVNGYEDVTLVQVIARTERKPSLVVLD